MKSSYEVVVVGSELPALLSAALLARRGLRVLAIEHDTPTPSYRIGPYTLPRQPWSLVGAHSPVVERVLTELALHPLLRARAQAHDAPLSIALPGHRFTMSESPAEFAAELRREFRVGAHAVEAAEARMELVSSTVDALFREYAPWPPRGFLESRRLAAAIRRAGWHERLPEDPRTHLAADHPYARVLAATTGALARRDPDRLSAIEATRLHRAWHGAIPRIAGGLDEFRRWVLDCFLAHGGTWMPGDRVERVLVEHRRISAVRTASAQDPIGAEAVVLGGDLTSAQRLFVDRAPLAAMLEAAGEPQTRMFRYTLNLVVAPDGIGEATPPETLWVRDASKPLTGPNAVRVQVSPAGSDGNLLLCAEIRVPRRGIEDVSGYVTSLRERVLESLGELLPFLGRHTLLVDSPHDGKDAQDLARSTLIAPEHPWTRGPATMEHVERSAHSGPLGLGSLPVETPFPNAAFASTQAYPGLGVEGAFLAAHAAAHQLSRPSWGGRRARRAAWLDARTR